MILMGGIIIGLAITGNLFSSNQKKSFEKSGTFRILSPQEAGKKAVDYINKYILRGKETASLIKTEDKNGIYNLRLKIGGNKYDAQVTKNGKILFLHGIDLTATPKEHKETSQKIPKRNRPDVKLFVMSYCPFGLQMEKAFLPVYKLLKDKAEMGVYFVDYVMHGKKEIDEELRQYCIQKKEKKKYYNYLSCFIKEGDFKKCLSKADINSVKLTNCVSETDKEYDVTKNYNNKDTYRNGKFPELKVQTILNKKYEIQGSPTVVINDKKIKIYSRSPDKFKEAVCRAFNSPPQECSRSLSKEISSAGF